MLKASEYWRVRTPTVIQMDNAECGAACLSILLSYYGRFIPMENLRVACGVSRDGSNALNLIKAAKEFGLEGKGSWEGLSEIYQVKQPTILFWNYNHFVVLEGFGRDEVYLNDPAFGPRTVTYEEFDEAYTGIALHFDKTKAFKKGGAAQNLWGELKRRLTPVKMSLLFILIAGFCLLIPGLALPAFIRIFIDNILVSNILPWKAAFLGAIAIGMTLALTLSWTQQYFLNRLNAKLSIRFSSEFLWHILRLPVTFYYQRYSAEIATRMNFNNQVAQTITGTLATTTIDLVLVIFYGAVMLMYDVTIASVGIIAGVMSLVVMRLIQRTRTDIYARLQKQQAQSSGYTIGAIQQIETVKATGTENDAFDNFVGYETNKINSLQEIGEKDAILSTTPVFFQGLAMAALLGIGGWRIMRGDLSAGTLVALQILLLSFLQPVTRFVNFGQLMQFMKVNLMRLDDVLNNPIDRIYVKRQEAKKGKEVLKLDGYLELKNVTFGYSPLAPPLIENLNIKIKPGQRVALVGPSGSGKSTISKLSTGLFEPWSGEITYDGKRYEQHPSEVMHRSLASVDQDIFLFSGSVRDNITLWDATVPDDMLIQAAEDASIHHDILSRPHGYDMELIEGGRNLSGGQRQRLEIARALLYNPSLLIMDEATSALDSRTEKEIMNRIRKRGCSSIMVAHRLSTIRDCDEIIVLERGKVVERGTHEELKKLGKVYKNLIESETVEDE